MFSKNIIYVLLTTIKDQRNEEHSLGTQMYNGLSSSVNKIIKNKIQIIIIIIVSLYHFFSRVVFSLCPLPANTSTSHRVRISSFPGKTMLTNRPLTGSNSNVFVPSKTVRTVAALQIHKEQC